MLKKWKSWDFSAQSWLIWIIATLSLLILLLQLGLCHSVSGINEAEAVFSNAKEHCTSPEILVNGSPSSDILETVNGNKSIGFNSVEEIQFVGIVGVSSRKRICRIKCIKGVWVGPICAIQSESDDFEPISIKECALQSPNPRIHVTHNQTHLILSKNSTLVADESILKIRCKDIGEYKLVGHTKIQCKHGIWDHPFPYCELTTLQTNLSHHYPPAILHTVTSGGKEIGDEGELIVTRGSIVHLDCIWSHQDGDPEWSWNMASRHYPIGWFASEDYGKWRYRVSIYYANYRDVGEFKCATPKGEENRISLRVKGSLSYSRRSTRMLMNT